MGVKVIKCPDCKKVFLPLAYKRHRAMNHLKPEDLKPGIKKCRECGCTNADCSQCIEKTGTPCYWVEPDLCSACIDLGVKCPGCQTDLTTKNAGGYRSYCEICVKAMPELPRDGFGYNIMGKYPNFLWIRVEKC